MSYFPLRIINGLSHEISIKSPDNSAQHPKKNTNLENPKSQALKKVCLNLQS